MGTPGDRRPASGDAAGGRSFAAILRRSLARHPWLLLAGVGGAVVNVAVVLAVPLLTQRAIDDAIVPGRFDNLPPYLVALVGLGVVRGVSGGLRRYRAQALGFAAGGDLRAQVFRHSLELGQPYHDRTGAGELMSRLTSDVGQVEAFIGLVPFMVQAACMGAVGIAILVAVQPMMAVAAVICVAAVAVAPLRWARSMRSRSLRNQARVSAFTAFVEQQIAGIRVIKGHGLEVTHRDDAREHAAALEEAALSLARTAANFAGTLSALPGVALLVVLALGGWLALGGSLSAGELYAVSQYVLIVLAPVYLGAQLLIFGSMASASAARLTAVLETPAGMADPQPPSAGRAAPEGFADVHAPSIVFDRVRVEYAFGEPVIEDLDLRVEAGTSVALVGPTGCGKTTLLRLVPRLYDVAGGSVKVGGVDVREARLETVRAACACQFDEATIFSESVRDNLVAVRPGATDHEVWQALETARVAEVVAALPRGLDTTLGERGILLSGGQRQRLALARAVLARRPVLLLDDPTSALDPDTAAAVHGALAEVMRGRTAMLVTHREELLELVDRVVLMGRGRIVAEGTHDQLLGDPRYRSAIGLEAAAVA